MKYKKKEEFDEKSLEELKNNLIRKLASSYGESIIGDLK